jgi:hypothetical protein
MVADPSLPAPLVPPEVDLRGEPFPTATFVQMAMQHFGMTYAEARAIVLEAIGDRPHDEIGEA